MNQNMTRLFLVGLLLVAVASGIGMGLGREPQIAKMSFFVTSQGLGKGGDLGGLAGADAHCLSLAKQVGAGAKTWHAYLSTAPAAGQPGVLARDRIGDGPWLNAKGVRIARNVADLHQDGGRISKAIALDEHGAQVNGRGDTPNTHDILTGASADGGLAGPGDMTCANWTSSGPGQAMLGHHDRQGGGPAPTSWNAAHASRGCSQADLVSTGGAGLFYCFAE